jgi:hypothetical protein
LFTNRSNVKWNNPFANLDGYSNDVLTFYGFMCFAREPAICETDNLTHSTYNGIIDVDSNSEPGESRWTLINIIFNRFDGYLTSYVEDEFPIQEDAQGSYSSVNLVFTNRQDLSQLVWSIYVEYMSRSYHQQHIDSGLVFSRESVVKNVL